MGETIEGFPLFPLGLVLLPSEVVPLHIFEERYKTMVELCLEEDREFGIVWQSDSGLRRVGCAVEVTELLERMDDGRLNILVEGTRPFELLRRVDGVPYPAGDIEFLDDEPGEVNPETLATARGRYAELLSRATDQEPDEADLADLDAFRMAASIDIPLDAKQNLLELRSEDARLRNVAELFGATMQRLDYAERAGELARSNGKLR